MRKLPRCLALRDLLVLLYFAGDRVENSSRKAGLVRKSEPLQLVESLSGVWTLVGRPRRGRRAFLPLHEYHAGRRMSGGQLCTW
jgi:hypothetical protein